MDILTAIINQKIKEIEVNKNKRPAILLESSDFYKRETISLKNKILQKASPFIIAEFKRKSPSKGLIHPEAQAEIVTKGYENAGASAVSILTDQPFFGGTAEDLMSARKKIQLPILRKDFILDAYQITETKAMGADLLLLIAACLQPAQVRELAAFAKELGLEVLLELHSEEEIEPYLNENIDFVGVNNRNLKNFEVSLAHSEKMAKQIPDQFIKIAESGLKSVQEVTYLYRKGFQGFLMGEHFMKANDPGEACVEFVEALHKEERLVR